MRLLTLARFFLFSFIFFVFLLIGSQVKSANAQNDYGQYPNPAVSNQVNYATPNTTDDVPKNLHTYTQNVMIETMAAFACQIAGVDPTQPDGRCLGFDPKTGKIGYVENDGGAIGFMGKAITMLYTPPAHTADYVRYLTSSFGISKNSYARSFEPPLDKDTKNPKTSEAGSGFEGLMPIQNLWEAFRDIAYLIFVLVFVIIGVAVMLRIKIDPRTVMTIQNQIPKIIIGLVLVTFSFAIAGFLIDIMWVTLYMFYSVFHGIEGVDVTSFNPINLVGKTPLGAVGGIGGIGGLAYDGSKAIADVVTGMFDNKIGNFLGGIIGIFTGAAKGSGILPGLPGQLLDTFIPPLRLIGSFKGMAAGSENIGILGGIVAFLILMIALLWALIRIWFTLLMAYIAILLGVVFAPFWIIGGLIPGSKISFTGWLRTMAGNLAAFPATLAMFLLGKAFIDAFATSDSGELFVPPFIGNPGDKEAFGALIGLGIILTIPNVVKMMKNAFGAGQSNEPSPITQAIMVGGKVPGKAITGAGDAATAPHLDKTGNYVYPTSVFAKAWRAARGR